MQLHPEDPRLTAFLLGELPADEAAAVEHAVAADPALGLAVRDLENIRNLLANTLAPGNASLHAEQRENILRTARHKDGSGKIIPLASQRRSFKSLLIPLSAAAIITLAVFLILRLPVGEPRTVALPEDLESSSSSVPIEVALLPAPGPPDGFSRASFPSDPRPTASSDLAKSAHARAAGLRNDGDLFLRKVADRLAETPVPEEAMLPPLRPRSTMNPADHPSLALPIHVGSASLPWITRSIRVDKKLPPVNAVRLEEILNHFQFRPTGPAAVSQGVTLSTETLSCPWKPSAILLVVSFRSHNELAREVSAAFRANPNAVHRYRLLGFSPVSGVSPAALPSRLPAKEITTLVIEIEPSGSAADLGTIEWFAAGQSAAPVAITRPGDAEPSDDARFATLVCTFAQWLAHDPNAPIDTALLSALARECAAEGLSADRVDFLNLIDQSLFF
jgi:hypothetical protein